MFLCDSIGMSRRVSSRFRGRLNVICDFLVRDYVTLNVVSKVIYIIPNLFGDDIYFVSITLGDSYRKTLY